MATMEASVEKMELLHGIQNIGISNPNEACLKVSTICIKANKAAASVTVTPYLFIEIDCISFLFIFICKFVCILCMINIRNLYLVLHLLAQYFFPFNGCLVHNTGKHWFSFKASSVHCLTVLRATLELA